MSRFLAVLPLLAACGPAPYTVYQIAATSGDQTAGCFGTDEVPDDVADDSTTFRTGDTFVIFSAPEDEYWLQLSTGGAMPGTRDGKTYKFAAKSVDKQFGGYDYGYDDTGRGGGGGSSDLELTTTVESEIKVTLDGRNISGSSETAVTFECDGRNCPDTTTCTTTNEFVGVLVDADVEYVIGEAASN